METPDARQTAIRRHTSTRQRSQVLEPQSHGQVKPEYRPMGAERYHSQAAVVFAVAQYRETGKILLHSEVKAILLKKKAARKNESQKSRLLADNSPNSGN